MKHIIFLDSLTEEQIDKEIKATKKRLQYLNARKLDLVCKRKREMQEQNGNENENGEILRFNIY